MRAACDRLFERLVQASAPQAHRLGGVLHGRHGLTGLTNNNLAGRGTRWPASRLSLVPASINWGASRSICTSAVQHERAFSTSSTTQAMVLGGIFSKPPTMISVGEYLLERLSQLGVKHLFGVPGDFNLSLLDIVEDHDRVDWVGCCNELNAGYAADGYARLKQAVLARESATATTQRADSGVQGLGVVVTTYGVGELSASNAIAGAFAERIPVLHIVGVPSTKAWIAKPLIHHTMGNGRWDAFQKVAEQFTTAQAYLQTADGADKAIDDLLRQMLNTSRPGYLSLPNDLVGQQVDSTALSTPLFAPKHEGAPLQLPGSADPAALVVERIVEMWDRAARPAVFVDACAIRYGAQPLVEDLLNKTRATWFTAPLGKSIVDETRPNFGGVYNGIASDPSVRAAFETADFVLQIGDVNSNLNSGMFSRRFPSDHVQLNFDHSKLAHGRYDGVGFADLLPSLATRLAPKPLPMPVPAPDPAPAHASEDPITHSVLWHAMSRFMQPGDIVVGEAGTAYFGLFPAALQEDSIFLTQTLWSSIGYATAATLGSVVAAKELRKESGKNRRTLLFTGDGSAQLTIQELSTMSAQGTSPIIIVLNNSGYTIERHLQGMYAKYNDISPWDWQSILPAFAPQGYRTHKATTMGELSSILDDPEVAKADRIQLVEVCMDQIDAPLNLQLACRAARAPAPQHTDTPPTPTRALSPGEIRPTRVPLPEHARAASAASP